MLGFRKYSSFTLFSIIQKQSAGYKAKVIIKEEHFICVYSIWLFTPPLPPILTPQTHITISELTTIVLVDMFSTAKNTSRLISYTHYFQLNFPFRSEVRYLRKEQKTFGICREAVKTEIIWNFFHSSFPLSRVQTAGSSVDPPWRKRCWGLKFTSPLQTVVRGIWLGVATKDFKTRNVTSFFFLDPQCRTSGAIKHEKVHPDPSNKLSVLNTPVHLFSCFPAHRNTQGEELWWLKNKALAAEGTAGRAMEGFLLIQITALRIYKVTPTSTTCEMSPQKNAAA